MDLSMSHETTPAQVKPINKTSLAFAPDLRTGMLPVQAFLDGFAALQVQMGIRALRAEAHPMRGR